MPFIDIGEKRWSVYEENWPKNRYNTTPHASPEAALHTGRRPTRSTPHLNATGGGEKTGATAPTTTPTPRPRPTWPKTNPPPPNRQNTPQTPLTSGRPKRGPKRQSDTRAPPSPDPVRDLGFPPESPGGDQETPTLTTPSRRKRRPRASPSSVLADRQDRAFAQRRVPRNSRPPKRGPAQITTCIRRTRTPEQRACSQRSVVEEHRGRRRNAT